MRPDIGVGPAIERTLFDPRQIIRHEVVAETVALLHHGIEVTGSGLERDGGRVAHTGCESALAGAVRFEPLDRRLHFGLDTDIPRGADADKQCSCLRVDREMAVLMTRHDAEHALLGEHFLAIGSGHRLSLLRSNVSDFRRVGPAGAYSPSDMRHFPDALLICDQHMALSPGEAVRRAEIVGIALDVIGFAVAVLISQQRQIAGLLFGHDHIIVWKHQKPPRMLESSDERRHGEADHHLGHLPGVGHRQRTARRDCLRLWPRQPFRLDGEAAAQFLIGIGGWAHGRRLFGLRFPLLRRGCENEPGSSQRNDSSSCTDPFAHRSLPHARAPACGWSARIRLSDGNSEHPARRVARLLITTSRAFGTRCDGSGAAQATGSLRNGSGCSASMALTTVRAVSMLSPWRPARSWQSAMMASTSCSFFSRLK